jgi:hypothetical protein
MLSAKGIIALAIAGISAIFLSSVVPVHAGDPAEQQEPVLYTDFDISKALDPWENIMALQLAIGLFPEDKPVDNMLGMPPDFSGWVGQSVGLAMICVGLFAVFITFLVWSDRVKRKRV